MVFIYILQLELNKYYIGKTNNPDIRLDSHFNSNGSEWTRIYKPIKVYELIYIILFILFKLSAIYAFSILLFYKLLHI